MEKFVCSHCGHRFESEAAENIVCPQCYWSTSVEKDAAVPPTGHPALSAAQKLETLKTPGEAPRPWLWAGSALFILLLIGVSVFGARYLKSQDEILRKIQTKNAQVIAAAQPELTLSAEEREILERSPSFGSVRPLTEKESQVLAPKISLRSRLPQGVATPPWDQKQFEEFLREIQAQYKLPLEWSYRRKLIQLFKMHYPAASQAFEAGDFLKARDEWIRSLAFPVYQNDVKKHRGVVLTILRPYINDVLSKIGAMNTALTGSDLNAQEEKIRLAYQGLKELFQKESWEEANARILEIMKLLEGIERIPQAVAPPPLPRETTLVDTDIQEVLQVQVASIPPSIPDLASLRQDLAEKEKVTQSRLPEKREELRTQYERALSLIKSGDWEGAREILKKIEYPEDLAQDARAKLQILAKLARTSLDSEKKSE